VSRCGRRHTSSPATTPPPTPQTIKTDRLPATRLLWLSEGALVTVGHNCNPDVFVGGPGAPWTFVGSVDRRDGGAAAAAGGGGLSVTSSFGAARAMFHAKVTKGTAAGGGGAGGQPGGAAAHGPTSGSDVWTKHTSAINCVQPFRTDTAGVVTAFSTSSPDGRIVLWDLTRCPHLDLGIKAQ
jgi:actin related protein 2/3 complex subunit 1A/1B